MPVFNTRRARPKRITPPRDQACNYKNTKYKKNKIQKMKIQNSKMHYKCQSLAPGPGPDWTPKGPSL